MAGMGGEANENWGPSSQRSHRPLSSTQDGSALWSVTWMEVQGGLWVSWVRGLPNGQWAVPDGERLRGCPSPITGDGLGRGEVQGG